MPSISDLFSRYGQPGGPSINPVGGALGQGGPSPALANMPTGTDIMSLIQMLLQAAQGGGGQVPLPPLDQGQMQSIMQEPPPAFAGAATAPPEAARSLPPPPAAAAPRKARPERPDESRAGKMGIKTQKGKAKTKPPKGRSSYQERFARDLED